MDARVLNQGRHLRGLVAVTPLRKKKKRERKKRKKEKKKKKIGRKKGTMNNVKLLPIYKVLFFPIFQ